MRLEKLNDNQIRCTLDRDDLVTRGLRLSELAYGTEKAKELFRDMMQQASYEFGFDAEDLPLMIEAIPTSLDRLVLVITKVEDPDELDTRFSKFSPDPSDMDYEDDEDLEEDFLRCLGQPDSYMTTSDADTSSEPPEFIPLPDCLGIQPQKKAEPEKQKVSADAMKVYSFSSLSEIGEAASHLAGFYHGENMVYKDAHTGKYFLVLFRTGHTSEEFVKACSLISEFGRQERTSYATMAYMKEHYECIIRQNAIEVLAGL